MGVDYTSYTGFGIKLANEDNYDEINNLLEEASEDGDVYSLTFDDDNIELIFDGMCGQYIYLLYKLDSHEPLYDNDGLELSLTEFKEIIEKVAPALADAVKKLGLPNIEAKDVKFISFTHAW